jgi:hypothetical protein
MSERDRDFTGPNRRQSILTDDDKHFLASVLKSGDRSSKIMGFRVQEVAVILAFLFLLMAFYIRTSDVLLQFTEFSARTQRFMDNSDVYHSTVLGVQFSNGKPENTAYSSDRVRREQIFEPKTMHG